MKAAVLQTRRYLSRVVPDDMNNAKIPEIKNRLKLKINGVSN